VAARIPARRRKAVEISSRNKGILQALGRPGRQSGQSAFRRIYAAASRLSEFGVKITAAQVRAKKRGDQLPPQLNKEIKKALEMATEQRTAATTKAASLIALRTELRQPWELSRTVGATVKRIDATLPGSHIRTL
jgi:hypothetical protein